MAVPLQKFREIVFQMLYSHDMGQATDENMLDLLTHELAVTKKTVREAQFRVHRIRSHLAEIDDKIASTSHSYTFERIQSVERNVLRLAVFELLFEKEVPYKVVMAEAMRLARKFGTKESASFVNAILETLYKSSLGEQVDPSKLIQSVEELTEIEKISQEAAHNVKQPRNQEQNDL